MSGLLSKADIPDNAQNDEALRGRLPQICAKGDLCIAGSVGRWIVEPSSGGEALLIVERDHARVRKERHNWGPFDLYSRPDLSALQVDRRQWRGATLNDE